MIGGTASFYQKKLEGEKRKGGGDIEERTPEIEMQLKLIYIILNCVFLSLSSGS